MKAFNCKRCRFSCDELTRAKRILDGSCDQFESFEVKMEKKDEKPADDSMEEHGDKGSDNQSI